MKNLMLAAICFLAGAAASASELATFRKQLIQGEVKAALQTATAIAPAVLSEKDAAALACMRARFAAPPAPAAGKAGPVLDAYRQYWHQVMLGQQSRVQAETQLRDTLNGILPGDGWDRSSLRETADQAKRFLDTQGMHALTGVTSPNYELMLWTRETTQTYQVALPERQVAVQVVFLADFLSKGWLSYASCDRYGAGGWTANGVLYAIADRYDTASEDFRVSYLGHEGQHFADNAAFPQLEQSELEYRAKLTELILSSDPGRLLACFAQTAQAGRAVPHPHAEYWLLSCVREGAADSADTLRAGARRCLTASSAQARKLGATTVKRLLPD